MQLEHMYSTHSSCAKLQVIPVVQTRSSQGHSLCGKESALTYLLANLLTCEVCGLCAARAMSGLCSFACGLLHGYVRKAGRRVVSLRNGAKGAPLRKRTVKNLANAHLKRAADARQSKSAEKVNTRVKGRGRVAFSAAVAQSTATRSAGGAGSATDRLVRSNRLKLNTEYLSSVLERPETRLSVTTDASRVGDVWDVEEWGEDGEAGGEEE